MATVIRELFVKFGIKADTRALVNFERVVESTSQAMEQSADAARRWAGAIKSGVQAAALGAAAAIGVSTKEIVDQGFQTQRLATQLGITTEEFQKLAFAAEAAGEDSQTLHDAMQTLGERFNDAVVDPASDAGEQLRQLGLQFSRQKLDTTSTAELWLEYADALAKIEDPTQRAARAMTLLGDDGVKLLTTMQGGREQLAELGLVADQTGAIMSEDALKATNELHHAMFILKSIIKGFRIELAMRLAPVMTRFVRGLQNWLKNGRNVEKMLKRLKFAAKVLAVVFGAIVGAKVLGGFATLAKAVLGVAMSFKRVGFFATLANAKVLLIPTAIAAIILLLQDMWVWLKGGDSLTGDFVAKWKDAPGAIGNVARALEAAKPALQDLVNDPKGGLAAFAGQLKTLVSNFVETFNGVILPLILDFRKQWQEIVAEFVPPLVEAFSELQQEIFGSLGETLPAIKDGMAAAFKAARLAVKIFVKSWIISFRVIALALKIIIPTVVAITKATIAVFNKILPIVTTVVDAILRVIDEFIDEAWPVIKRIFDAFSEAFNDALAFVKEWAPKVIKPIKTFLADVKIFVTAAIAAFKGAWDTMRTEFWDPLWAKMQGPIDTVKKIVSALGSGIKTAASGALALVKEISGAVDGFTEFLGLRDKEERKKREGFTISGTKELSAEAARQQFMGAKAGRGVGALLAGGGTTNNVGQLTVNVQGSPNMSPQDTARAVQQGVGDGMKQAARDVSNG